MAVNATTRQTMSSAPMPPAPRNLRIRAAVRAPFGRRLRRRLMRLSMLE
jgi:hypothetical protein